MMERKIGNKRSNSFKTDDEGKMEKVDLSGLFLESLPNPSLNLAMVGKLDISNNNLQTIPESLTARLLNLVVLDVHSNQLISLPSSIGCLSKLKVLNISSNMIDSLPVTIENCRSLEELNANFNKLTKLPETMGFELTNLQNLSVHSNKLVYLPFSTSHITSLRILDAHLNCLRSLPEDLENLANLEILNVSQNFQYLDSLPDTIGLLPSLIELDVSYNKITILPNSIGWLKKLQKLHVHGNPLVSPPMEIVDESLEVVKAYMRERLNGDVKSSKKKQASWMGKLVMCGTFNGRIPSGAKVDHIYKSAMSDYQTINALTSPRYMSAFSPRRLFSPKHMGMFSPQRFFSPQKQFSK